MFKKENYLASLYLLYYVLYLKKVVFLRHAFLLRYLDSLSLYENENFISIHSNSYV